MIPLLKKTITKLQSTTWDKFFSKKTAKSFYYFTPTRYRARLLQLAIRVKPSWFLNHPLKNQQINFKKPEQLIMTSNLLLDLDTVELPDGFAGLPGKIAVHCHIFYIDLIGEFIHHLSAIPFSFSAYISVRDEKGQKICNDAFSQLKNIESFEVKIVPNRGRDIAPMLCEFGDKLMNYDYFCHIHSKKSSYNDGATQGWREYLFDSLLSKNIKHIFALFRKNPKLGIIYPQNFDKVPYMANHWLSNQNDGAMLCSRLNITMPEGYFNFPAGSMCWLKTSAIRPLFDLKLTWQDFPEEKSQNDGTLAHAIERILGILPIAHGYKSLIIKDMKSPSNNHFRLDTQYINTRTYENMYDCFIKDPQIKVVAFDVFDTLLVRPLINPDHTKKVMMTIIKNSERHLFENFRHLAEKNIRKKKGKDVSIVDIYSEFSLLTGITQERSNQLRLLEEKIEIASVTARKDVVRLFYDAKKEGKHVILVSDIFLSEETIHSMLKNNGIEGYNKLYLSSARGLRKDTGDLYALMLKEEGIRGEEVSMFGDNAYSDFQIPTDYFNIRCGHILRASDLAKNLPVYEKILAHDAYNSDLNKEISIALLVRENLNQCYNFSNNNIFCEDPVQLGFNLVGPVVLGFCQWIIEKARIENITKFYFLSREGKLIKEVYDIWAKNIENAPESFYLQTSRRLATVSAIFSFQDIKNIAKVNYFPNKISTFLSERFGLTISENHWKDIYNKFFWKKDDILEISDGDINKIKSLLNFLYPEILCLAKDEKCAFMQYLEDVGFTSESNVAIIDVGYSGTIQKCLNLLVNKPVHGYYFATSRYVRNGMPLSAVTRGCYVQDGNQKFKDSRIFSDSFNLEKLLSSNELQIIRYFFNDEGVLDKELKIMTEKEKLAIPVRNKLQSGVISYVEKATQVRNFFAPNFCPSLEIADELYRLFLENIKDEENNILKKLAMDDDYCGRGVV